MHRISRGWSERRMGRLAVRVRNVTGVLSLWVLLGGSTALGENTSGENTTDENTAGENASSNKQPLVALGRALFFDVSLSADGKVSCATCHRPELGYADGRSVGQGAWGRQGTRNVPTLLGLEAHIVFNWDGRTATLEEQVLAPFTTAVEHGLAHVDALVARVSANASYGPLIENVVGREGAPARISESMIAQGLAAFVRSLSGEKVAGHVGPQSATEALPADVDRGRGLFVGEAGCATCHRIDETGTPTTDNEHHALGLGLASMDEPLSDVLQRQQMHQMQRNPKSADVILGDRNLAALGRFNATSNPQDIARFRTPSLKHAVTTAPYFHDGGVATLEEAVEVELYYRRNVAGSLPAISREERDDLVAYIRWIGEGRR